MTPIRFAFSLILALGVLGCGSGDDPVVADPDGDDEADEEVAWDPAALNEIRIFMDSTHASGFVVYLRDEIVADGYNLDPNLRDLPEALQESWQETRRQATPTGYPVEDVGELQTAITGLLVMKAVEEGFVELDAPVGDYLGTGWSRAGESEEAAVTLRHLLSMTSGLNNRLEQVAAPGTEWRWNIPAFRVLHDVLPAATGFDLQGLTVLWLTEQMGLEFAEWASLVEGSPLSFYTTPPDLGSIGLAVMGGGVFQGDRIFDAATVEPLVKPSQQLNPAWGLGWWVNGQSQGTRPGCCEPVHSGSFFPTAPTDMVFGWGHHDHFVAMIPLRDIVIVRFGAWIEGPGRWDAYEEFWRMITLGSPR